MFLEVIGLIPAYGEGIHKKYNQMDNSFVYKLSTSISLRDEKFINLKMVIFYTLFNQTTRCL